MKGKRNWAFKNWNLREKLSLFTDGTHIYAENLSLAIKLIRDFSKVAEYPPIIPINNETKRNSIYNST